MEAEEGSTALEVAVGEQMTGVVEEEEGVQLG